MEDVSDPESKTHFEYSREQEVFIKTFAVLEATLGDEAFSYANKTRTGLTKGFGVYHFEAFTIGLQPCLDRIRADDADVIRRLRKVFTEIKLDADFIDITTGGGKNSPGPLRQRVDFVTERVKASL
jgi:hypothetical protein